MSRSRWKRWLLRQREEVLLAARDLADLAGGRRDPLMPPRRRMYDGPRDPRLFRESGAEFLGYYRELCGLGRDEHVLDVGSGMGRKTVPLTSYLSPRARYAGLDVNRRGVDWCRGRISSRFPNFEFHHIDVYNRRYNPGGTGRGADYRFPFPDRSFDFVVLASVFTHMKPAGVRRYLEETARVLRRSGRCLISFFLLDAESEAGIAAPESAFRFGHRHSDHAIEDPERPEDAVAYNLDFVRRAYAGAGLEVVEVHPGGWSGRQPHLSFQDLVLGRPAPAERPEPG